jgi:hypothetical protein
MNFFSHFKIIVSFVTLISTMEHQFGVKWPRQVAAALELLSILSLDLKFVSSLFCVVKIDFWQNILSTTLMLSGVVVGIALVYKIATWPGGFFCIAEQDRVVWQHACTFFAIYFLTFSYPLVSVKIVQVFSCHNVGGEDYLRADYSLTCYNSKWRFYAGYSMLFVVLYVCGFPLFVLSKLWRYRSEDMPRMGSNAGKQQKHKQKRTNEQRMLGFLRDDYKSESWACLWEFEEVGIAVCVCVQNRFLQRFCCRWSVSYRSVCSELSGPRNLLCALQPPSSSQYSSSSCMPPAVPIGQMRAQGCSTCAWPSSLYSIFRYSDDYLLIYFSV